ncbi:hypothetical protein A2U01_0094300, partial [Trifolium medium]|nr:hypothetical protein [Trifolium medium]
PTLKSRFLQNYVVWTAVTAVSAGDGLTVIRDDVRQSQHVELGLTFDFLLTYALEPHFLQFFCVDSDSGISFLK